MKEFFAKIAPPIVVLGFYPLIKQLGNFWGGPDIPQLLLFLWNLALALSVLKMYRNLKE